MMKRTPKYYDGIKGTNKNLQELLPHFLAELQGEYSLQKEEVFKAWYAIIGENLALIAVPISFTNKVLKIEVKSQTLYSIFCTRDKPHLLRKLQERLSKNAIEKIVFRIG